MQAFLLSLAIGGGAGLVLGWIGLLVADLTVPGPPGAKLPALAFGLAMAMLSFWLPAWLRARRAASV